MNPMHSAEQQLNLALQQNEAQQKMISHITDRLAAMEEAGMGEEKIQLLTNQLNSAAIAASDVAILVASAKSPHPHSLLAPALLKLVTRTCKDE
jgi:hypothetical protein